MLKEKCFLTVLLQKKIGITSELWAFKPLALA